MIRFLEAQRLRRQLHQRRRRRPHAAAAAEPQGLHVQRPRRVLVGRAARERRGRARRRRQPRLLQRQRGVLEDALGAQHRRLATRRTARSSPTRTRTSTAQQRPGRRGPAPGATRASPRRPTAARPENALTGQSFLVNSGTSRITVPVAYRQAAAVAQHRRRDAGRRAEPARSRRDTLGYEWDVDADNGFRPPGAVRALVDDRQRPRGLHRLRQHDRARRHRHAQPDDVPRAERRAACSAPAPSSGPGASTTGNPDGDAARPQHAAGDGEPVRRHGRAAGDAAVRASSRRPRRPTRPRRPRRSPRRAGDAWPTARRSRSPAPRPTPAAAWSPASRSRPTAARPGTRRPGTTSWTYTLDRPRQPVDARSRSRAVDDSGNLETPGAGIDGQRDLPVLDLGHERHAPAADATRATPTPVEVGVKFKSDTLGHDHRRPLLQGRGQHRHPRRQPVERRRARGWRRRRSPARRRRGWQTVTFSTPVAGHAGHDLRRVLLRAQRPLRGHGRLLLPQPRARARTAAASPTAPPLHALRNTGARRPTASTPTARRARSRRNTFGAANYWVDVVFTPTPRARAGDRRQRDRRRHDVGDVTWTAPVDRRRASTSYKITPYIGSTAQTPTTINGTPPATSTTVTGLTTGTTYTFTVQAINPTGAGPVSAQSNAVTPLPRSRPSAPTGVAAQAAVAAGAGDLDGAGSRRRQPDHRLHGHAVHRRDGADAGAGRRLGDQRDGHRPDQRHHLHVQGHRDQRGRHEPRVGASQRRRRRRRRSSTSRRPATRRLGRHRPRSSSA